MATNIRTIEMPPRETSDGLPPLLLLLHGYGSNEYDLIGLADYLDPRFHIVSARAILDIGFGYAWYHLYGVPGNLISDDASRAQSLDILTKFIADLPGRVGADPQRVYVLGFSQGGLMTLGLALTVPHLVAGAVPISCYLDEKVVPQVQPDALAQMPLLVLHGVEDDLIPVAAGRQVRDYLQQLPVDLTYQEYPIGHGIHPDALPLIQRWFAERLNVPRA